MMCICGGAGKIYAEKEILLCFDERFPMGVMHTSFPYRQETAGERFPVESDALWSTIQAGIFTPERFDSGSLSFSTLRRQQKKPVGGETDRFLERG